ncbi:TetR/AcrR family transcriptional regulator [Halosegnis sp.]|uniref:TetR/AcrR family transcriptional regulator n=1 Tax=Halosegnis sp. TaxID=2864959 RepID=UPI0035D4B2F3
MDDDTREAVMAATYRALCRHGYAELTTQRIADEWGKSKAALHYHYDTKEELLRAFLDYLLDRFESRLACESADPRVRLDSFVDAVFAPAEADDDSRAFAVALLELKAQAPYTEPYRDRLAALDERLRETVASAVRDGIEAGHFRAVDPDAVARFVVTAIDGAHVREVTLDESPAAGRRLVEAYLDDVLGRGNEPEVPV